MSALAPLQSDPGKAALEETPVERALLGGLLLAGPEAQDRALAMVDDRDLGDPQIAWLFPAVRAMREAGMPVDLVTLPDFIRELGRLPDLVRRRNLASMLYDITRDCPVIGNVEYYAAAVIRLACRRRVERAGQVIAGVAGDEALVDVLARVTAETAAALHALQRAMAVA